MHVPLKIRVLQHGVVIVISSMQPQFYHVSFHQQMAEQYQYCSSRVNAHVHKYLLSTTSLPFCSEQLLAFDVVPLLLRSKFRNVSIKLPQLFYSTLFIKCID